ncbi:MAG: type IV conjugative transfer system lipoprotein TraV [Nitrosomonas sp.]|nr:type IV conjugative transfer system lipoprotein TraV [Nitrosomonas sp.]
MIKPVFLIPLLLIFGGCTTISGYDSKSKFSCKAPNGVSCSSMSGVYANAVQDNLPGLRRSSGTDNQSASRTEKVGKSDTTQQPTGIEERTAYHITGRPPQSGEPILIKPKLLRVWIAPWEDADGDLHDQSYIYMLADYGRWVIEHHRQRIVDEYRPTSLVTIGDNLKDIASEQSAKKADFRQFSPLPQPPQPSQYSAPPSPMRQQHAPLPQDDIYPEEQF